MLPNVQPSIEDTDHHHDNDDVDNQNVDEFNNKNYHHQQQKNLPLKVAILTIKWNFS